MSVLDIKNIHIDFPTSKGVVHAVTDVSLSVEKGRRIGFIGESGSGKTTTALAIMQMLADPGFVASGEVHLNSPLRRRRMCWQPQTQEGDAQNAVRFRKVSLYTARGDEFAQPGDAGGGTSCGTGLLHMKAPWTDTTLKARSDDGAGEVSV